ncbi:MAG: hypothetical protein GY834_12520 [Bacteroidetes bacterium]|nr:hypothetical protein [Bacteroidota bacterium]
MEKTASIAKSLPLTIGALFGFSLASYMLTGIFTESAIGRPSSTAAIGLFFAPIYSLVLTGVGALIGLILRPFMLMRGERDVVKKSALTRFRLILVLAASLITGVAAALQVVAYEKYNTPKTLSNTANFTIQKHSEEAIPSVNKGSTLVWGFGNKNIIPTEWLGSTITFNVTNSSNMSLFNNSSVQSSYDFSGYSYVTEISTLPLVSSTNADYFAVLVKLRATSRRSMLLIYDEHYKLVYERLLDRCGRTQYIGTAEDINGNYLVINLCKPFTIDFNN